MNIFYIIIITSGLFLCNQFISAETIYSTDWKSGSTIINDTSVGSYAWANAFDVEFDDSIPASATIPKSTATNAIRMSDFGFELPENAIINGLEVRIRRKSSAPLNVYTNFLQVYYNGSYQGAEDTSDDSVSWPLNYAYEEYGGQDNLWSTEITRDDVASTSFGFGVGAFNGNVSLSRFAYLDFIEARIFYTLQSYQGFNPIWFISTVFASTTCEFTSVDASTTEAICSDSMITNPTQDVSIGLIIFILTFFGIIFYFRKGVRR